MQALIERLLDIRTSQATSIKLERLKTFLKDLEMIASETALTWQQEKIVKNLKDLAQNVMQETVKELDIAESTRRNYF